jgi:hypothetical protein
VQGKCITLRLTEAQRKVVQDATGEEIEALSLPLDEITEYAADPTVLSTREAEAVVWECLNPYP